jgi:hypothetical protein
MEASLETLIVTPLVPQPVASRIARRGTTGSNANAESVEGFMPSLLSKAHAKARSPRVARDLVLGSAQGVRVSAPRA